MLWLISGKQKVRFPEFLQMLAEQTGKMISTEKEILAAFTALVREKTRSVSRSQLQHLMTGTGEWGGTGGSEPPASRTLLSRFPYFYLLPPALFRAAPVPCKLAESKHILVL